jgi:hypothetical protein
LLVPPGLLGLSSPGALVADRGRQRWDGLFKLSDKPLRSKRREAIDGEVSEVWVYWLRSGSEQVDVPTQVGYLVDPPVPTIYSFFANIPAYVPKGRKTGVSMRSWFYRFAGIFVSVLFVYPAFAGGSNVGT